ncbi:MAG: hypothetical protein R3B13_03085 [Polyangiaceae bacterium]
MKRPVKCLLLIAAALGLLACGGSPPPPAEPAAPSEPEPPASASVEAPPADPPEESAEPATNPDAPREVQYVMKPTGLVVQVGGASFTPKVKAVRVGAGWGVRVEVAASVEADAMSLLAPKDTPLAFAASIERPGGDANRYADERKGEDEVFLSPGQDANLVREFPGKTGEKPFTNGTKLKLEVGLWGLGPDAKSRRPVRKLFVVAMEVGKKTPQPVVSAPAEYSAAE